MIKTFIFKGIIWNSLLIMFLCENGFNARFIMKKCPICLILLFCFVAMHTHKLSAQDIQHIKLNSEEVEMLFLENNLALIAEKYNVAIADAQIIQAKLWENPTLTVNNLNLWKNERQFSVELSQLIQTANKRAKLVRRENVTREIAIQEFNDVLRGLKAELRKSVVELQYLQSHYKVLLHQHQSLTKLTEAFAKQVQQGDIARTELLRLQLSRVELENEINDIRRELMEQEKALRILLHFKPFTRIEVVHNAKELIDPKQIALSEILPVAFERRPDMQQYQLYTLYHKRGLDYEKSMRIPEISFAVSYDRYGGVWKDFVGIGVSIDLPIFNRNQGGIKAAKLSIEQSKYREQQQQNIIGHEIAAAYENYVHAYDFHQEIKKNSILTELDEMLAIYAENLLNKNISMIEYIDFMESYRKGKQTIHLAKRNVDLQFEELQFTVGAEIR